MTATMFSHDIWHQASYHIHAVIQSTLPLGCIMLPLYATQSLNTLRCRTYHNIFGTGAMCNKATLQYMNSIWNNINKSILIQSWRHKFSASSKRYQLPIYAECHIVISPKVQLKHNKNADIVTVLYDSVILVRGK